MTAGMAQFFDQQPVDGAGLSEEEQLRQDIWRHSGTPPDVDLTLEDLKIFYSDLLQTGAQNTAPTGSNLMSGRDADYIARLDAGERKKEQEKKKAQEENILMAEEEARERARLEAVTPEQREKERREEIRRKRLANMQRLANTTTSGEGTEQKDTERA